MHRILEKKERRLGEKLLLKGDRCSGPKCAAVRRGYPPGIHGKKRRRGQSEYGILLNEKQKVRFLYGIDNQELAKYSKSASAQAGVFSSNFIKLLETRLDNVVFRIGLANSRRIARQLVGHGHILVNAKKVSIPSFQVKKGDQISLNEKSASSPLFSELTIRLKKYEPPKWIKLNPETKRGEILDHPEEEDAQLTVDVAKVKEFYSR